MSTQHDPYDATKAVAASIPPFVRITTGEVELDARGELLLDENDEPKLKTQPYLVRRTGEALKQILKLETDQAIVSISEVEEEEELLDKEEKAREEADGGPIPDEAKVDVEWLSRRREARSSTAMTNTYKSLALLLVNPSTGEHPDPEELEKHLDFVVASQWMSTFVPQQEQAVVQGENGEVTRKELETPTAAGSATDLGASD